MSVAQLQIFGPPSVAGEGMVPDPGASLCYPRIEARSAAAISLRPYQRDADAACDREHASGVKRTLVVMATGTGKTVSQAHRATKYQGRVLVICDRDDLLSQNRAKIEKLAGEPVGLEQAASKAGSARIVMASVPTLRGDRLKWFAQRHKFDLILADEAHHAPSKSWREVISAWPEADVEGWTATPRRGDGVGMHNVFESVAYKYDLQTAIGDGWLSNLTIHTFGTGINLDGVSVSKGKFAEGELDDAVAKHAAEIVRGILEYADGLSVVVFTPGVKTAHIAAEEMNRQRPGYGAAIDGRMDRDDCERIKRAHEAGEIKALFNCQKLIEGYDNPRLRGVMVSATIRGESRLTQMVGRVTRPWPGTVDSAPDREGRLAAMAASPKPVGILLDPKYNSERHDIGSVIDVLDGTLTDDERKAAKRILAEKGGNPADAIAEAKARVAEEKARLAAIAARAAKLKEMVTIRKGTVRSLFEALKIKKRPVDRSLRPEDMPSPKQIGLLRAWGIDTSGLTKRDVRKLFAADSKREKQGRCRIGGINWLAKFGVNGWPLTRTQALRIKYAIVANGNRPLAPGHLQTLLGRAPGQEG